MLDNKLCVLFIQGARNGCDFYRIYQPGKKLIETDTMVCALSSMLSSEDMELWIDKADVFLFQKTSDTWLKFMYENKDKKKFIMDQDDDNFAVSPYNPGYRDFGVKEVDYFLGDGSKVKLRDGDDKMFSGGKFDIEKNKRNLQLLRTSLSLAHKVTTPSPLLSGKIKRINSNTAIIPNFLNFENWSPVDIEKDDWVRIGYQCGWSHFEDFWEIQEALRIVMEKYSNVRLVIMGQAYDKPMENYPQERIDKIPWVDMETYPWRLKCLNLDIGIAPLVNNEFNNGKSVIKWEEYSALKIPTVASNVIPYNLRIVDGDTGFLCRGTKEWVDILSWLVVNRSERVQAGNKAYEHVRKTYDLNDGIVMYENLIKEVCGVKPEILTVC